MNLCRDRPPLYSSSISRPILKFRPFQKLPRRVPGSRRLTGPRARLRRHQGRLRRQGQGHQVSRSSFLTETTDRLPLLYKAKPEVGLGGRDLELLLYSGVETQYEAIDLTTLVHSFSAPCHNPEGEPVHLRPLPTPASGVRTPSAPTSPTPPSSNATKPHPTPPT